MVNSLWKLLRPVALGACAVVLAASSTTQASAQATSTASKTASIDVFAGFAFAQPDYGPYNDTGISAGVDYTRYLHLPIDISLELRGNDVGGTTLKERTVLGGLKVSKDYRRFTPYADLLFGIGTLVYNVEPIPGYHEDRGRVFSYGAGVDVPVYRTFSVKADFQLQSWNLGINSVTRPQGGDYTLSPTVVMLGVSYRIPFRPHIRQND